MYAVVVCVHKFVLCDHSHTGNPYKRGGLIVVLQFCDAVDVGRICMNNPAAIIF